MGQKEKRIVGGEEHHEGDGGEIRRPIDFFLLFVALFLSSPKSPPSLAL